MLKIRPQRTLVMVISNPLFNDYWMQDLPPSGDSYRMVTKQERKSDVVFFPGCQPISPSPVLSYTYEYLLREKPTIPHCISDAAEFRGRMAGIRRAAKRRLICAEEHLGRPLFVPGMHRLPVNLKQHCPEIQTISVPLYGHVSGTFGPHGNEIVEKYTAVRSVRPADDPKTVRSGCVVWLTDTAASPTSPEA